MTQDDQQKFAAALDAILWLEFQVNAGQAKKWSRTPSRYKLNRDFATPRFCITSQSGQWILAVREAPTLQWFAELPWMRVFLNLKQSVPLLSLVCSSIHVTEVPEIDFGGDNLPIFGIDIEAGRSAIDLMQKEETIRIGTFTLDADGHFILGDLFGQVPLSVAT